MIQYLLLVIVMGQPLFSWNTVFDSRRDCDTAANLAINMVVLGRLGDGEATCYEFKDGRRGDFVSEHSIGCSRGLAPMSKGGCGPAAP